MRRDDEGADAARRNVRDAQGGIPDGLLIGILAFLLGMTLLVWTATGLAAYASHGDWPSEVTFTHTPLAMRHLIGQPHDLPGAWPNTPASQLSGYGLFWGLLIGQLMILFVLTVFTMGTVARWRMVRARRKAAGTHEVPTTAAADAHEVPTQRTPEPERRPEAEQREEPTPLEETPLKASLSPNGERVGGWENILLAPRETRQTTATEAVQNAAGPTLVLTSNPTLWHTTKDPRSKLGPVLLYDPTHLCDTPARLHWPPTTGCESKETAAERATALLTPVRPTSRLDQAVADTAETLLRCYLHAAAIDGRTIRHVHRWTQGTQIQDAVRILRTSPKASSGTAGELEATLTAHPERKDIAQELMSRALAALTTVNIREACTPNRSDALALDSFIAEGGTLYVVGESIEDPRTTPGAMPFLTALVASVVERGRRMAERSPSGRLDPPLTLILDDVAAVAPLPQLPDLLAEGKDRGLPTLALLRSREQARTRWPHAELPV